MSIFIVHTKRPVPFVCTGAIGGGLLGKVAGSPFSSLKNSTVYSAERELNFRTFFQKQRIAQTWLDCQAFFLTFSLLANASFCWQIVCQTVHLKNTSPNLFIFLMLHFLKSLLQSP